MDVGDAVHPRLTGAVGVFQVEEVNQQAARPVPGGGNPVGAPVNPDVGQVVGVVRERHLDGADAPDDAQAAGVGQFAGPDTGVEPVHGQPGDLRPARVVDGRQTHAA